MTILYASPLFERHETGEHPECPARLRSIARLFAEDAVAKATPRGEIVTATPDEIAATHAENVAARAQRLASAGGGRLDADTIVSRESYDTALKAAGTAMAAVDSVMSGTHANALCLIRPPGHHATRDQSMGFCLFNNVALAAQHAIARHGAGRILIVDWDVHHGNGTQDIFYDDDQVTFFSIHRFPFYPGTGRESETGTGRGLGATINVPVTVGTPRRTYLDMFRRGLEKAAERAKPDLVLISAGFDAHAADPIGNLGLATEDFTEMTKMVRDVAAMHAGGRIVSCLEGGYDLEALAASVLTHLTGLTR